MMRAICMMFSRKTFEQRPHFRRLLGLYDERLQHLAFMHFRFCAVAMYFEQASCVRERGE